MRFTSLSRRRVLIGAAVYVVALFLVLAYLRPNAERYLTLFVFSPEYVLLIVTLVVLPERGLQNYVLYPALGAAVSLGEAIVLSYVNTLANQLPVAGGLIAKGVFLKRRYRLPYARYLGATIGLLILAISVGGLAGLGVLVYLALTLGQSAPWPLVAGFSIMALAAAMLWLPMPVNRIPHRLTRLAEQLLLGREFLAKRRDLIVPSAILQLATVAVASLQLWAAFRLMSQPVPLTYCLLFAAASLLTQLVSIAPGGLGVREAIVAGSAGLVGIDPGVSLIAVGIDRLLATATIVVIGSFSSAMLSRSLLSAPVVDSLDSDG
jgi:uncharacterized membrane protein YbhN (UPF0104 family)